MCLSYVRLASIWLCAPVLSTCMACYHVPCLPGGLTRFAKYASHPEIQSTYCLGPDHIFYSGTLQAGFPIPVAPLSSICWKPGHPFLGSSRGDGGWLFGGYWGTEAPPGAGGRKKHPEIGEHRAQSEPGTPPSWKLWAFPRGLR